MLQRVARGFFGGLWVFPGGAVDTIDDSDLARRAVSVPDDSADFPSRAAVLRETVEEVGLALTAPNLTEPVSGSGAEVFEAVLARGAVLDGRRLRLVSQWVTPRWAPVRFDTRFYLAVAEGDPALTAQPAEVLDVEWVTPADALRRAEEGRWPMITPTLHHLRWLDRHPDVTSIWAAAGRATGARVEPLVEQDGSEVTITLPESAELP